MRYIGRVLILQVLVLFLAGCATVAKGPSFSEARAKGPMPGHAIMYVYRKYAEPTAWGAMVQVDGADVSTLNQGGFTWVYVKPGKRVVSAVWHGLSGQSDSKLELDVSEGNTYYLEVTGISRVVGVFGGMILGQMGSGINNMKPDFAEQRLDACCKFQPPVTGVY